MSSCRSMAALTADIWSEWGKVIDLVGDITTMALTNGTVKLSTYTKAFDKAVQGWNALVGKETWKTIGPRDLKLGTSYTGTLRAAGERCFITPAPLYDDGVTLSIKKTDGKSKTIVTVCKVNERNQYTSLDENEFDKGNDNVGEVYKKTFRDLAGCVLIVHLNSTNVVNSFSYTIKATKSTVASYSRQ
jgi:hypothetical protein